MKGLFSDQPHLCLEENFWDEERGVATRRFFIVDANSGRVIPYAMSTQAYTEEQCRTLLDRCGFADVVFYPSLAGGEDLRPIVASRRPA